MSALFLAGCGQEPKSVVVKEATSLPKNPRSPTDAEIIEIKIRTLLKKPTGELTAKDFARVTELDLGSARIRSVDRLVILQELEVLRLKHNAT